MLHTVVSLSHRVAAVRLSLVSFLKPAAGCLLTPRKVHLHQQEDHFLFKIATAGDTG